jgi:threonine/homoserine/homoserine lactone efflux protein
LIENIATYSSEFITIASVHLLAVASPGSDFAVVVRQVLSYGRRAALFTSLGIALGIVLHVSYWLLGIGFIVSQSAIAFTLLKYLGAIYLAYLGLTAILVRPTKIQDRYRRSATPQMTGGKAMSIGFITNTLNPKVSLFFLAVFTAVVSPTTPLILRLCYGLWVATITFVWFAVVSTLLSQKRVMNMFYSWGLWIERAMGLILIAIAIKVALSSVK